MARPSRSIETNLWIFLLCLWLTTGIVSATTITVNGTGDTIAADGFCTLREAISAANTNAAVNECPAGQASPTVDNIALASLAGAITLGGTQLAISEDVNLNGPGANVLSINGNNASRVFSISAATVGITGVTITGGKSDTGCGVQNTGNLTLTNCAITGNSDVATTTGQHLGGGLNNTGTAVLQGCTVANNTLTAATLINGGGGIVNFGTLTVANSTITGNSIANSTSGTQGGGIANLGSMTIVNCTIAGNSAISPGPDAGGGFFDKRTNLQTAVIANTILVNNTGDSGADGMIWGINGGGALTGGFNLIGAAFLLLDGGAYSSTGGDQIGTGTANLGTLQNNGGTTDTMALLPGSTAIDAGDDNTCANPPVNGLDQRGVTRPQDGDSTGGAQCDIGSFEVPAAPTCLFCDDFNGSSVPAGWTVVKPAWSEAGGNLVGASVKKAVVIAQPAFAGCVNCSVQTRVQTAGGTGNTIWIFTHFVDKNNHMELLLKQENNKVLLKQKFNKATVAKGKGIVTLLPNTFYTVEVTFNGTQFEVFVDGNSVLTLLPAATVPTGTVGFQVKGTTGSFDFINVN